MSRGRLSEIAEVVFDLGAGPVLRSDELTADAAGGIDDVGLGRAGGAVGKVGFLGEIEGHDHVADVVVDEELMVGVGVGVEADGQHHHSRHLLLNLHERGQLFEAGWAPGGPEIQNHRLAAIAAQADGAALVVNGEVRGKRAYLGGMIATVASDSAGERESQNRCQRPSAASCTDDHVSIIEPQLSISTC